MKFATTALICGILIALSASYASAQIKERDLPQPNSSTAPYPDLPPTTPPPDYTVGQKEASGVASEPAMVIQPSNQGQDEAETALKVVLRGDPIVAPVFPSYTYKQDSSRPQTLTDLENLKSKELSKDEMLESVALRPQVQRDAALSAGIKAGVRYRYQQILDQVVEPNKTELDMLFNFTPLLITEGEVVATPPIIARAGAALRVGDDGVVSFQKGSYKFVSSANIITGVPTWRNYLYMNIAEPEELHPSILPINSKEIKKWKASVNEGWKMGIEQAELLFESNVAKLVRDYKGMLIYYGLAAEGLVEKPVIKTTPTGNHIMTKEVIYERTLYQVTQDGKFRKPPPLPRTARPKSQPAGRISSKKPATAKTHPGPAPQKSASIGTAPKQPDQGDCAFARSPGKGTDPCPK